MILIGFFLVVCFIGSAFLFVKCDGYSSWHGFGEVCGLMGGVVSVASLLVYVFSLFQWFAADYKADIINREYGTAYTQAEMFWASDVIDTVRELQRKRVELNGDLITGE